MPVALDTLDASAVANDAKTWELVIRNRMPGTRRALDNTTGATLREIELEAGATGAPMTCRHTNTKYVVFAIGGQHPAEFVALSLPRSPRQTDHDPVESAADAAVVTLPFRY